MFDGDRHSLRKIRAQRIGREEAEQALVNDPIPVYEEDVAAERRFVYCGETNSGGLLAVVVTGRGERIRVVTVYDLDAGQRREYFKRRFEGGVNTMGRKILKMPRFKSESEEADWWASPSGRAYVKQRSAEASSKGSKTGGSRLVATLNEKRSVQIAIRLPGADLDRARELAGRKGIGYQTLLKMLVHEGLAREARR